MGSEVPERQWDDPGGYPSSGDPESEGTEGTLRTAWGRTSSAIVSPDRLEWDRSGGRAVVTEEDGPSLSLDPFRFPLSWSSGTQGAGPVDGSWSPEIFPN